MADPQVLRWPPPSFIVMSGLLFGAFGALQVVWSYALFGSVPLAFGIAVVAPGAWFYVIHPTRSLR